VPRRPPWRRRIKARACFRAARIIRPVVVAYQALYEDAADSGPDQVLDLTGTTSGQFEVAANMDHRTSVPFGFTSARRARHATGDRHEARPGIAGTHCWPPGV